MRHKDENKRPERDHWAVGQEQATKPVSAQLSTRKRREGIFKEIKANYFSKFE